jgi:cholesterol transport system auxiliary component
MKKISILFLAFTLTACASILPKGAPAPRQYTLNAPHETVAGDNLPVSLQILIPQVKPGLETDRIVLRRTDNQVDYFADTKWAGNLAALTQSLLVESFESTHRLQSVSNDLVATNQNYNLSIEIRDFQAEYIANSTTPRAHIQLVAKLIRSDTNVVVATSSYNETEIATDNTMETIIPAFDKAWQRSTTKLIADMLQDLQQQNTKPVKSRK